MQVRAGRARVREELGDGVERHVLKPRGGPHGLALAEEPEELGTGLEGQLVHAPHI